MEEKSIDEINKEIIQFKQDLEEKIKQENNQNQENKPEENEELELTEILNITYYEDFDLKTKFKDIPLMLDDIYVVELEKSNSITYEIYKKDTTHKIAQIDIEGKITFIDKAINDNTTIEEIKKLNENKKSITYTKAELDELEEDKEQISSNKENTEQELSDKEENNDDKQEETEEISEDPEKSTEQLEEALNLDEGDIRSCVKVKLSGKDNLFFNKVPEARQFDEVRLVYISSMDTFKFVGLKKGQPPKYFETIESSQETMKTTKNIDSDTGKVEEENIYGLMKCTTSKDYDFSVKIGQYGYIELSALRKDPVTNKYISTKVETTTQRPQEKQQEVNQFMDKNRNTRINEEIEEFEKEKNEQGTNPDVNVNYISDASREEKEKIEEENDRERTLDENVRKYFED